MRQYEIWPCVHSNHGSDAAESISCSQRVPLVSTSAKRSAVSAQKGLSTSLIRTERTEQTDLHSLHETENGDGFHKSTEAVTNTKPMTASFEERIGGNLPATAVRQLHELMQHAPVKQAIQILELRVNLAFQILEVEEEEIIWKCLDAWLEVREQCCRLGKRS